MAQLRTNLGEVWPFEFHQHSTLSELAIDAYANEEMLGEFVVSAVDELNYRGYSEDEFYRFVTWGDNT